MGTSDSQALGSWDRDGVGYSVSWPGQWAASGTVAVGSVRGQGPHQMAATGARDRGSGDRSSGVPNMISSVVFN